MGCQRNIRFHNNLQIFQIIDNKTLSTKIKMLKRKHVQICESCTTPATFASHEEPKELKWCENCKEPKAIRLKYAKAMCENCQRKSASFAENTSSKARWCADCKQTTSVDVRNKRCKSGCGRYPHYKMPDDKYSQWCAECRPLGAILANGKCEDCDSHATFGLETDGKMKWCVNHKPAEAISLKSPKCETCNTTRPHFGYREEGRERWCGKCKPAEAVSIYGTCENCDKQARFAMAIGEKKRFCADCKPEGAVYAVTQRCCETCDKTRPHFGLPGEIARWCGKCRPQGAVNLHEYCEKCEGCRKKIPAFGLKTEMKARWCVSCKPKEAENVNTWKCEICDLKCPSFGFVEEGKRRFCSLCKPVLAINLAIILCECKKSHSHFGYPGLGPKCCTLCKKRVCFIILTKDVTLQSAEILHSLV
jgi:hypothetical protein